MELQYVTFLLALPILHRKLFLVIMSFFTKLASCIILATNIDGTIHDTTTNLLACQFFTVKDYYKRQDIEFVDWSGAEKSHEEYEIHIPLDFVCEGLGQPVLNACQVVAQESSTRWCSFPTLLTRQNIPCFYFGEGFRSIFLTAGDRCELGWSSCYWQ